MTYFTKRYHPPGTSPGTLAEPTHKMGAPLTIHLLSYNAQSINETESATTGECQSRLADDVTTWIHVQGQAEPEVLRELGATFGLHMLALEDVVNVGQRPKVDHYEHHDFAIVSYPAPHSDEHRNGQVSLFLGNDFVISFYAGPDDIFAPVVLRLRSNAGRLRQRGADYLFYSLLDLVIDAGFPMLESFGEAVEELEDELLDNPSKSSLRKLHELKRELLLGRRSLWPHRDVLNSLIRDDSSFISDGVKIYLRDCYDHTVQIMDLLETYRDITASMLDIYLSSVSYRLNDVMRVLTMIATLFIPLTFITSVYGMNFGNNDKSFWAMPELRWEYGYPVLWLIIIAVASSMLIFFRRKGWL